MDDSAQENMLHSFSSALHGANHYAGGISDAAGSLDGTTIGGGAPAGLGTVYKIDASGQETVLHSFTGTPDGVYPHAGVIRDAAGNLYGTTENAVYKIDASGQETVLHTFNY